jgi:hypothetical protein
MTKRLSVLLCATIIAVAGCSKPTQRVLGVRKDPYEIQRGQFLNTERALHEAPPGAQLEGQYGLKEANGNGGSLANIIIPDSYGTKNVVDFYLDLFAQQGHNNLNVICSPSMKPESPEDDFDGYGLSAVAWNGTYGYLVQMSIGRGYADRMRVHREKAPHELEINVQINTATNPDMPPPTSERPIHQCVDYPKERMANILRPYGYKDPLTVPEFWPDYPYTPVGGANTERQTPPNT